MKVSWHVDHSREGVDYASCALSPSQLDLDLTLGCGQAFRWKQLPAVCIRSTQAQYCGENRGRLSTVEPGLPSIPSAPSLVWTAVAAGRVLRFWRANATLYSIMEPGPMDIRFLNRYLDLRLDLEAVRDEIGIDGHILQAETEYPGLRILQQEPWETLIAFILSQWSNVTRISNQMESLAVRFGTPILPGFYAFPMPWQLAAVDETELKTLGLGYRAKYVLRAARKCTEQGLEWLQELSQMDYRTARDHIVKPLSPSRMTEKVYGVGPKVADCILLFSLGHYEAFPIDVHVRRAMERWYGDTGAFGASYDSVADFGRSYFGRYAGYAQQYLFHRQRVGKPGKQETG